MMVSNMKKQQGQLKTHIYLNLLERILKVRSAAFQQNHVSNVGHINVTQVAFVVDRAITEASGTGGI